MGRSINKFILGHVLSFQWTVPFEAVNSSEMESPEVTLGLGDWGLLSSVVSVVGFLLKGGMLGALHPTTQGRSNKSNKPQTTLLLPGVVPLKFPSLQQHRSAY